MRILITGTSGQLGKDFVEYYKNSKYIILSPSHLEFDITNRDSINNYIEKNNVDIIINCAAYTAVDKAEIEKDECYSVNTLGVKNLVHICKKYDITLIHISTDYVFDGLKNDYYSEISEINPLSVYGKSKAEGEKIIIDNLDKYFIIRTSWLFGIYGKINFVNTMINLMNKKSELFVVNDEIGSPTFTEDLIEAIDRIKDTTNYGVYNIHNDGYVSRYDFAKEIKNIIHSNTNIVPISSADYNKGKEVAQRPLCNKLSLDKISKYYKMPHWKDALNRYITKIQEY